MKIIEPNVQLLSDINETLYLQFIELAARTCYKSEDKITDISAEKLVRKLLKSGHHAMLEHAPSIAMKFICDRGVSHCLVRHRLFSFAQESTMYCNYSGKNIIFILPCWFSQATKTQLLAQDVITTCITHADEAEQLWISGMLNAELNYHKAIELGWTIQQARSFLPNSTKTEIVISGNAREWRHMLSIRTDATKMNKDHLQVREICNKALQLLQTKIPVLFEDLILPSY